MRADISSSSKQMNQCYAVENFIVWDIPVKCLVARHPVSCYCGSVARLGKKNLKTVFQFTFAY